MTFARFLLLCCLLISLQAVGQDAPNSGISIDDPDAAERIRSEIAEVEALQGLDAETRTGVLEKLRDVAASLQRKLDADAAAALYASALDKAPEETSALRKALDEPAPEAETAESLGIEDTTPLSELQQRLAMDTAGLTAIDSDVAELTAQIEAEVGRPALARERIGQLEARRKELAPSGEEPTVVGERPMLSNANRLAAQFRRAAQGAEINKLEQEILSHAVRLDLLRAKLEVAVRSQVVLERRTDLLRAAVNERQQIAEREAQQAAIAAEMAAADKHPVVRSLAEDNASLAVALPKRAEDLEEARFHLNRIQAAVEDVQERFVRSRQHIEIGGRSRVTGRLLIEERVGLAQVGRYWPLDEEISEVGLALMFIQEQQRKLTPLDDRVEELMAGVDRASVTDDEFTAIGSDVRALLQNRRDLLVRAENNYRAYLQVLGDLDTAQTRLLDSKAEYRNFLNQNLLWIPSAPVAFSGTWGDLWKATKRVASPSTWRKVYVGVVESLREDIVATVALALLFGALLLIRPPLASLYDYLGQRVGRLSTDNIGLTLGSLAIAMLRAAPVPLLLYGVSRIVAEAPLAMTFTGPYVLSDSFARSLFAVAPFLFNTLVFRILSEPGGVFREHFGWNSDNVALIRRQLDWLAFGLAPLVFVIVFVFASEAASDHSYLGRLLFVLFMVILAFVIHPLVNPGTGLVADYYKRKPEAWVSKLRWVWYSTAVGLPLLLGLMSFMGNVYTSTKLAGLFVDTVWLAFGLVIVNMVFLRWLALSHRKLALRILLQQREAQKAEREAGEQPGAEGEVQSATTAPLDLDVVDQQSRKLIRLGLVFVAVVVGWGIWSEILPALTLLDDVSLWSKTDMVDGVEIIAPVTLADLLLSFLVIVVAIIAARNLPGFIELAIPRRLAVERGSRYAINTLVRYLIIMVGVVTVLNLVGWRWSQIQWLVAALSVGLGFGLQEIVANFVSGLVILFERPVRVGDTVTVGQLSGTVTRIRIRATTIVDWDRKEIIVPNKSFITEQVVNWTLTDPITRIVIPVGVAYGSDVGKVHKIISETLPTLPLVLDEPLPKVYFTGFGESSLDFQVHVYLRHLTDRMPLIHEVHNGILAALREHGVQIPFPQRDLHIRSTVEGQTD